MTTVIINPGTWDVEDSSHGEALLNMQALIVDAGYRLDEVQLVDLNRDNGGRWMFSVVKGKNIVEVDMPGWTREKVRWLGDQSGNIWLFPRLYVDGNSWVWKYAISSLRDALENVEEDDEEE